MTTEIEKIINDAIRDRIIYQEAEKLWIKHIIRESEKILKKKKKELK